MWRETTGDRPVPPDVSTSRQQLASTRGRRRLRVLFIGYFDRGNVGDNAMRDGLQAFVECEWSESEVRWTPLPQLHPRNLGSFVPLIEDLRWADLVILAGGTHFHDDYGARSLRILASHLAVFLTARALGTAVGYAAIGVGPLRSRAARMLTAQILAVSDAVLVRDDRSLDLVRRLWPRTTVTRGVDTAFMLTAPLHRCHDGRRVIGVSILPYFTLHEQTPALDDTVVATLSAALKRCHQQDPTIEVRVLVFFQGARDSDLPISQRLVAALSPQVPATLLECSDARETLTEIAQLDALIATRYHAAVFGYLARCPMVVVSYQEKCSTLAAEIELPTGALVMPRDLLDEDRLFRTLTALTDHGERFTSPVPRSRFATAAWNGLAGFFQRLTTRTAKGEPCGT